MGSTGGWQGHVAAMCISADMRGHVASWPLSCLDPIASTLLRSVVAPLLLLACLQLSAREASASQAESALQQQTQHMEAAAQLTQREAEVGNATASAPA